MVDLILFTPDHILFHNSMQNGHNGNALWSHALQKLWTKYFKIRPSVPLPWKTKVWKYVCLIDRKEYYLLILCRVKDWSILAYSVSKCKFLISNYGGGHEVWMAALSRIVSQTLASHWRRPGQLTQHWAPIGGGGQANDPRYKIWEAETQ